MNLFNIFKPKTTLWVCYWRKGLPNHKVFDNKEDAKRYMELYENTDTIKLIKVKTNL